MLIEIQNLYVHSIFENNLFILYIITLIVDILTGNAVALFQKKWNSRTGINGTIRHFALLSVAILLLPMITFTTNIPTIANGILLYIIGQYTISILENISILGFDLNEPFTEYFTFLGSEDKENKQEHKERDD